MALALSHVQSGSVTTNPGTTASVAFLNETLYLLCLSTAGAGSNITSVTGGGLGWTKINGDASGSESIAMWTGMSAASAITGALTLTGAGTTSRISYEIIRVDGANADPATNGIGAIVQHQVNSKLSNQNVSSTVLGAFEDDVNNAVVQYVYVHVSSLTITKEASHTSLLVDGGSGISQMASYHIGEDLTSTASWPTAGTTYSMAVEIAAFFTPVTRLSFDLPTAGPAWGVCQRESPNTVFDTLAAWPDSTVMRTFVPNGNGHGSFPNIPIQAWSNKPPASEKDTYTVPSFTFPSNTEEISWTVWHEFDRPTIQALISISEYHDLMDRILSQTIPENVHLQLVTTAWGIASDGGNRDYTQYLHDGVTDFGADFDGFMEDSFTDDYHNIDHYWLNTLDELDIIRAQGYRISVPEFGIPKATWDTSGQARADWMMEWAERFMDFGEMHYVCLFDHTNDDHEVRDAPGVAAWEEIDNMTVEGGANSVVFG